VLSLLRDARISTQISLRRAPEGGEALVTANLSFPYESDMDWRRLQRIALQWKSGVGVGDAWLYELTFLFPVHFIGAVSWRLVPGLRLCGFATGVEARLLHCFLFLKFLLDCWFGLLGLHESLGGRGVD
jgi:hypothetical protein